MRNLRSIESSNGSASLSRSTVVSDISTATDILMSGGDDDRMPSPANPSEDRREEEEGQNWIYGGED